MKFSRQNALAIIVLLITLCVEVQAQTPNFGQQLNKPIFVAPPPPPDIGEPGKRSAAGSRGCGQDMSQTAQKRLTALVPVESKSEYVSGTTISERPNFWFYVPYSSSVAYGEFVLEQGQNQTVYKTSLAAAPGIINLRLPSSAAPLEIDKRYRWYFNIYCNHDKRIVANVEGYVQRVALNSTLKTQLEKATPTQRVALYGANGIWHEALSIASDLRDTSWAVLLQNVGLKDMATEPRFECCKLESH